MAEDAAARTALGALEAAADGCCPGHRRLAVRCVSIC